MVEDDTDYQHRDDDENDDDNDDDDDVDFDADADADGDPAWKDRIPPVIASLVNQQSFGKGTAAARWMKACFTGGVSSIEQAKTAVWGQGSLVWHASKLALVGKPRGQG